MNNPTTCATALPCASCGHTIPPKTRAFVFLSESLIVCPACLRDHGDEIQAAIDYRAARAQRKEQR
jgi:hypothetical protein